MSTPTIIETEYIDLDKETKKAKILDLSGKIIVAVFGIGGGIGLILLIISYLNALKKKKRLASTSS
jgi:hypothetical protein